MNSNIRDFIKAIQNANKTATSAYDTAARVTRVEGSTAWVHVEGGVEETPVEMSISCEPGDDVRVRINKGAAYIIGNNTNPPTNDKAAVQQVINISRIARQTATKAYEYLQSLFDELSKYVAKGTSNIGILSEVMTKTEDGVEIYSDEQSSAVFHTDDGSVELKQRSTTSAEAPAFFHVDLYKKFFGNNNSITGNSSYWSVAEGLANEIKDSGYSHAFGISNKLTGAMASIASGNCSNINGGQFNFAFGNGAQIGETDSSGQITASGSHNFAEGLSAKIKSGDYNVAMGHSPSAEGSGNTVFGGNNSVRGSYCYANGWGNTIEGGFNNHAEGQNNRLYGSYNNGGNHIEGRFNKIYGDSSNSGSTHVEGFQNTAYGSQNHIEGSFNTVSNGSNTHVQGMLHTVNGSYNHVGGYGATVRGQYNLIESLSNVNVTGDSNAVTGGNTTVEGSGNNVVNAGDSAKIKGSSNISAGQNQSIEGKYNAVFGYSSRISGNGNLSSGGQNETYGNNSAVGGTSNKVLGNTNFIHGEVNSAYGTKNTIFGSGNIIGSTADETYILFGDGNTKIFYITASNCRSVNSALVDGSSVSGSSYGINGWEFYNPPAKGAVIELNYSAALGNTNTLMVGSGLRINGQGNVVHDELGDGSKTIFTLSNSANSIDEVYKETEYTESGTLSSAEDHIYLDNIINRVFSVLIDGEETTSYVIDSYELSFESELPAGTEWSVVYTSMKTVSSYSFTAGNNYIDLQTAVGDGLVLSVSYDTGIAQTPKLIFGMGNDPKDDTVFELAWTGSTRKNAFEVTQDGYLRTGVGMAKIAFGKNGNGEYGYWIPATQSEPETFVPWITQDTTYTAGANIVISNNNVISAPNVAPIVNGKVPEQYLPSYVDDVIEGYYNPTDGKFYEESTYQTEIAGERGKIYISLDTDKSYRWSGTVFVELPSGGVVYSAGSGIDISATNEISADNTIARMTDLAGYLPLAGGTMAGAINSQNIIPATDDSYRLGSSTSKYNSAYIKRIYNLASIESTTDGSKRLLVPAKSGTIAVNEDLPEVVGNLIAVNPFLTSGRLIANVTISGVSKNIYSPVPDWAQTVSTEPDYIKNKPTIPSKTSDLTNNSGFITLYDIPPIPSRTSDLTNNSGFITINDIPTIPDELADLTDDSTHRLVTDTEKSTWNGKSDFSGSYNDLSDKPTIPAAQVNSDWNATSGVARILNKPTIPSVPVTIQNGGTGGTTVAAARANLDVLKTVMYGGYYPSSQTAGWYTIFEFPHYTMTLAILQIISEEYENSSAIVFINGRYAQQGTSWANQSPEVTLFGNVDYGTAGGYTKFRITQNGASGRLALDIYANGRGANLRIKVLYCDVTDYNVYSTLTPAVYSTVLREVRRNFLDSIETTGNLSLRDSIYMRENAYVHTGAAPKNADSWSEFLNNSGITAQNGLNICQGINETSGIHMDGNTIVMWSPCDDGALWYYDEDEGDPVFHIDDNGNYYNKAGISYLPLSGGTINGNTVINHTEGNWVSGLRINSVAGNANGSANITLGGQSGTTSGTTSSYPMYQVGKMNDLSGGFAIRAAYNGTYNDVFKLTNLNTGGITKLSAYTNGTKECLEIDSSSVKVYSMQEETSEISMQTSNLVFTGTETTDGFITSGGTGDSSRPFKITGYESSPIAVSTTAYPSITLKDGDLILLFLSSGAGNSFYAARLLRNNNGSLQSINLATTGTSHATVTMRSNGAIVIQNTSSSYKLNYKMLRLG